MMDFFLYPLRLFFTYTNGTDTDETPHLKGYNCQDLCSQ